MVKIKILKPKEVSEMLNVTVKTLQNWDYTGKLVSKRNPNNRRFYTEDQIREFVGLKKYSLEKITIGYCRVSSLKQKNDLERQVENVKLYLNSKGNPYEIITDIGSGINYNKKGLNRLIKLIVENKVDKIVIAYKDRLLRLGFDLIQNLCELFNTKIEIIDNTEKTEQQELIEDLTQIITVFSCKLQGKRAHNLTKIIKETLSEQND